MDTMMVRKVVRIDPDKCDGCGLCVPSCAEGAIQVIDGKARLVADNLCDGLGACLGKCPRDAITIEDRPAEQFDERAVSSRRSHATPHRPAEVPAGHAGDPSCLAGSSAAPPAPAAAAAGAASADRPSPPSAAGGGVLPCGCPGTMARKLTPAAARHARTSPTPATEAAPGTPIPSALGHWPVQLALLPVSGPIWQDADVLISADCVPFALGDFHSRLLAGRTLAIACPKLDDPAPYVEKLARIFAANDIRSVTVARMEVPCCGGLVRIVQTAMGQAGKSIPLNVVIVGVGGTIVEVNDASRTKQTTGSRKGTER